jgi:hypothetical protein
MPRSPLAPAALVAMLAIAAARGAWSAPAPVPAARVPVLLELFTSEGCSSCPAADDVLARLVEQQPVAGVEIIGMSEHVDYWNRLGWSDPWSHARYTTRQKAYARALGRPGLYTPQAVVDGRIGFVGSDFARTVEAAARAGREPKATVDIERAKKTLDAVALAIEVKGLAGRTDPADVYLAITEDDLVSNVTRGENQGRRLAHVAVVRRLTRIGRVTGPHPFAARPLGPFAPGWKPEDLRAVVFAQDARTRAILGVSSIALGP